VVGTSEMKDRSWHAFIYDGTRMTDLGASIGIGDSFAAGINNAGHVVGTYQVAGERYGDRRNSFVWRDGKVILHSSGKGLFLTNAINNEGQIIGATYDRGMNAAAMHSNTVPFVDLGGTRIIGFNLVMIVLAAILVIFRKRWKGMFFANRNYSETP